MPTPRFAPAHPSRRRAPLVALALLVGLVALSAQRAAAQDDECDPPGVRGPLEVTPAAGASGVPLDHPLRILFTADYFGSAAAPLPDDAFDVRGPDDLPVAGEVQLAADDVLFFLPAGGWQPDTLYSGTAFGEVNLPFTFRTSSTIDQQSPTVSPLSTLGSTRVDASCQLPNGGFRVDLEFSTSLDDGAAGSIEYHLYLARAEGLEAPREVARLRNFTSEPDARVPISFLLDERFAGSPICVQLMATDGIGNVASSSPFCFDPVEGANFAGLCSAGPRSAVAAPHGALTGVLVAFALGLARARRRRASATTPR
jgi:hypothetical protein